jgi:tripartite-type tricarboxylate transporter receptor subunit TctC
MNRDHSKKPDALLPDSAAAGSRAAASRRRLVLGAALASVGSALPIPRARAADTYPNKAISLIVPFAAGGPTDVLARVMADSMARDLGQPIVVENTPGAGGTVGTARVSRMPADGYAILIGNNGTLGANATLYKKLSYNVMKDFITLASIGDAPQVIVTRKDLKLNGIDEFAKYAREHAKDMNYGAAGVGSGTFLGGLLVNDKLGIQINAVNYRGAGPASNDLIAGHLDYMVESSTTAVGYINAGMTHGVAALRSQRLPTLPNIPCAAESSFPDLLYDIWNILLAPAGTPAPVVARLNQAARAAIVAPATREKLGKAGIEIPNARAQTPEGASEVLSKEIQYWAPILTRLGISVD